MGDSSDYSLAIAKKHVDQYNAGARDLLASHAEAMECRRCEEFLQVGLDAFHWLQNADRVLREAARERLDVPEDVPGALAELYRQWLVPCELAEQRIRAQEARNYTVSNLTAFREACEHVKRRVWKQDQFTALDDALEGTAFDDRFWQEAAKLRTPQG